MRAAETARTALRDCETGPVTTPTRSRLMPWAIVLSTAACIAADAAWLLSPDNQLAPDGSTYAAAYLGSGLAVVWLVLAAIAAARSPRDISWTIGLSTLATATSPG